MIELLTLNDFLDSNACSQMIEEMRSAGGSQAEVYGKGNAGSVDSRVRKVTRVAVSTETVDFVAGRMLERKTELENYFSVTLSKVEEPQFLHYRPGDYFVAHQDGNTPLVFDDTRFRKISVVAFLNAASDEPLAETYTGGSLVLHGKYPNYDLRQAAGNIRGSLAAFRSETTHEVEPVAHGERFTIVSWFQ